MMREWMDTTYPHYFNGLNANTLLQVFSKPRVYKVFQIAGEIWRAVKNGLTDLRVLYLLRRVNPINLKQFYVRLHAEGFKER